MHNVLSQVCYMYHRLSDLSNGFKSPSIYESNHVETSNFKKIFKMTKICLYDISKPAEFFMLQTCCYGKLSLFTSNCAVFSGLVTMEIINADIINVWFRWYDNSMVIMQPVFIGSHIHIFTC